MTNKKLDIKSARKKAGITQQALAAGVSEYTGKTVTQSTISCWESGYAVPSADKLPIIAKLCKCSKVDGLFVAAQNGN